MISLKHLQKQQAEQGFTIIELLIVIVVVVVLSALVVATYGGIQQKNRNLTRENNLEKVHEAIEKYFITGQHYPSRADMNNASWLSKNLTGFDANLLVDPSNKTHSALLVVTPSAGVYAYSPTQIDGASSCEAKDTTCAKYILTATYEGSVNGLNVLAIKSTN
jgi:prepilin-type N-terminal cleavage/methylation domain-containing protein